MSKPLLLNIIDRGIFIFTLLFVLTLTISIFLNQLGYYGALLLLLFRLVLSGENPFSKTGLEPAFILFIAAEFLSAIFSDNQAGAFFFMAKRVLLLPVVYMIIASASDQSRGKKYLYFYMGGAFVSVLIYLFYSYRHLMMDLYNIQQSGPSIFQYPITASEIMSFTVIIFFAFISKGIKLKYRILAFIGFAISSLALFSTYKRTGWIGAVTGIIVILIMRKQWKLLGAGVAAMIIIFLFQENVSRSGVYRIEGNRIQLENEFETEGRAYHIFAEEDSYYISDFHKGISVYDETGKVSEFDTPSPVTSLYHWRDNYYAALLLDTRFILLKKEGNLFKGREEFLTPGLTYYAESGNGLFYVLDADSGLTIFLEPQDLDNRMSFREFSGYTRINIDSEFAVASSNKDILVAELVNGIPSGNYYKEVIPRDIPLSIIVLGKDCFQAQQEVYFLM
jgi:hypothetical protein